MTQVIQVSAKDTGKMIRKALKKAFPGIKFSVRMSRGTAYGSYSINWTDGPALKAVDKVVSVFSGKWFDGMTDSTHYYGPQEYEGKTFHFGAGYVHTQRTLSPEAEKALADSEGVTLPTCDFRQQEIVWRKSAVTFFLPDGRMVVKGEWPYCDLSEGWEEVYK